MRKYSLAMGLLVLLGLSSTAALAEQDQGSDAIAPIVVNGTNQIQQNVFFNLPIKRGPTVEATVKRGNSEQIGVYRLDTTRLISVFTGFPLSRWTACNAITGNPRVITITVLAGRDKSLQCSITTS